MKKNIILFSILILISTFLSGQEIIEKKYLKNEYGVPAPNEKKAKYIKITTREPDGTIRYETRHIASDKIVRLSSYKDGIPVGKWITYKGKESDYDFELIYRDTIYENLLCYDLKEKTIKGDVDDSFEAPVFPDNENDFRFFIAKRLQYPPTAAENGIQGRVYCQFIIDESGKLVDLSIYKSADPILDKEAARVIRESPNWIPAKIDNLPIRICITMPIVFVLQ